MTAAALLTVWSEEAESGWDRVCAETAEAAAPTIVVEDVRVVVVEHNSHGVQVAWTVDVYLMGPHLGRRSRHVENIDRELHAILWWECRCHYHRNVDA